MRKLEQSLEETRRQAAEAVEKVHSQYRRELVPVDNTMVLYGRRKR